LTTKISTKDETMRSSRTRRGATVVLLTALVAFGAAGCGTRESAEDVLTAAGVNAQNQQGGTSIPLTTDTGAGTTGTAATGAVDTGTSGTAPGQTSPNAPATSTGGAATAQGGTSGATSGGTSGVQSGKGSTAKAGTASQGTGASALKCTQQLAPVVIGQVGTFTGVVGAAQVSGNTALFTWAKWINARGGVACHPVQVYSVDDQADNAKTSAAVADLVENKHAVAIVASFTPLTEAGIRPYAEKHNIPLISGDQVAPGWVQSPMFFNMGGTFGGAVYGEAKYAVDQNVPKLGLLACVESTACTNFTSLMTADGLAKKAGAQVVYNAGMSLTQPSFTSQCQAAQQAGVQMFVFAADTASLSRLVRDCTAIGFKPRYASNALGVNAVTAKDPRLDGLIVGNVVFPWADASIPATQDFQNAMKTYAPNATLSGAAALAWVAGQAFAKALNNVFAKAAAGVITTPMVLEGLYKFKAEALGGLIPPTTYSTNQPHTQVNLCYTLSAVKGGAWTAPFGSKVFCAPK
jgi:branched-chain amino acid transport system substrate-binding protein